MASVEITAYRGSPGHGNITSIMDGRNNRLKIGKTMRRTTAPIPVLPPRIPTPMPKPPKERYDVSRKMSNVNETQKTILIIY